VLGGGPRPWWWPGLWRWLKTSGLVGEIGHLSDDLFVDTDVAISADDDIAVGRGRLWHRRKVLVYGDPAAAAQGEDDGLALQEGLLGAVGVDDDGSDVVPEDAGVGVGDLDTSVGTVAPLYPVATSQPLPEGLLPFGKGLVAGVGDVEVEGGLGVEAGQVALDVAVTVAGDQMVGGCQYF
jgi:hypothetical protein